MAQDYADRPVVLLEYYFYTAPSSRTMRFWSAYGSNSASFPMVIVDSGHQVTSGYHANFYNDYKTMIDAEFSRPPQAEITATYQRIGNHVNFTGQVKNLSSVTLSSLNLATIHGIVYEDAHVGVTNRYVRAAVATNITSALAPSATTSFTTDTTDLTVLDWNKLHYLVLVDYRPAGTTGPYDMLQAAFALP